MKNVFKKVVLLTIPFLLVGCGATPSGEGSNDASTTPSATHRFDTKWEYDETHHWHPCKDKDCEEKGDYAEHTFGAPEQVDPGTLKDEDKYKYVTPTVRRCSTCGYYKIEGTNILPELHFNFGETNTAGAKQETNFMNIATKKDLTRPEIEGTYTLTNCADKSMEFSNVAGTMKVRGNQTAGWRKKGFRIKFAKKRNVMGLNDGNQYKKWILLADAKDTTLIRSAAGLYLAREVCKDDPQVWVCDYTPVTVYLNGEYWGYYYLGEQKEVNANGNGRVQLPEVEKNYTGTDIGYCFELDYYADGKNGDASEKAKGADGDPTFTVNYFTDKNKGDVTGNTGNAPLPPGNIKTYTMLSDITDGTGTGHIEADYKNGAKTSNSNQLSFIRDRLEQLYEILYSAAMLKTAKEIDDDNKVVASEKTVQEVVSQYFDLNAWADGFIINAFSCPPDLGYSSFYMSYDNSPTGDKKLRYDVPWDFDSNFGNRLNFNTNADQLYVDKTHNKWIQLLSKLDFFINIVGEKWNTLREDQVFENMFKMMKQSFTDYDKEIKRNHFRWPENDAASRTYNNFDEIRSPFDIPAKYKEAETETLNWCAKRVNYLEKQWGNNRPNINPNA